MNLQEYKRAYPQFSEWDDEVLVNRLYREEGRKAGLSFDDFSKAVGFAPEPEVTAKNTGLLSTIGEGVKSVGRAARATFNLHQGDAEDLTAISNDAKAALSNEDARLTAFKQDIQARKERLGEDPSWLQTGLELLSAAANNPSGAGLMLAEQLPNSAAAMAGGYAGMQAGAIAGPVGAVAGGIVGMFGANYMLEGGNKAIEAAQAGQLSPDDMDRVKGEGLTKAGIITGVDVATMGLGSKLFGATQRAVDRAGARVLAEAGVDATDRAAINAAVRANPALAGAVMEAEKLAFDAATTVGQRAMRGTAGIGLETFGEGLGEYVGEGVATGKWDKMEAMLEAFSSLGQSAAESVFVANRNDVAMTVQPILNAQTADEAIAIAQERVSADLTSAVTDYQSLFASAAPSGSFDQLVQNELNPVAATQLGEDQALQNYLRNTDTDTLVRDLVHADQASFERIVGGLSERAADMVLNDISSALRSATDEQLAQSPGYAAQIEMQRRRELHTEQAYSQQSEQQIAADRQKAYESGQIAEQARDQQVDLQTTISQVNEAPAVPTVMEQAMAGAQQGPSRQEQLRLEQARIRQQLQQTRDANRTQAAQLADNEAGNFSTARQARPADAEAAPLSAPANNTENAKSLSRMMNGAPVADVTVQVLAGKFDSIPRLMAQTVQKIGKMLGRQVVFFEGGIADGAAPQMRDDKRIFINIKQGAINPLSILGHEMMHRLRIESPKAYQTLVKAVRDSGIITDEMLADYDADYNSKDYADLSPEQAAAKRAEVLAKIKSDKKTTDFLLEEMLSDLNGNRFTEADFWTNVFQKIEEREGREAAKPIIARLREALIMAINRLMTAMKTLGKDGKFGADQQIMDRLGEVKSALEEAFATYMQEMKDGGSGQLSVPGAENRGQAQRADMAGGMADAGMAGSEPAGRGGVPARVGAADPEAGAAGGEGGGGLRYSKSKPATYSDIKRGEKIEQAEPLSEKQWSQVREIALEELSGKDGSRAVEAERDYLASEALANRESERYKEVAREKLGSMATPQLSTVPVMEGKVKPTIVGTGKNNKTRVFDVARVLRKRILARAADITTVEGRERVARAMVHEALYSLSMDGHAVGRYDRKVREALAVTAMAHPEILTNKEANLAFRVIAAVTSNGQAVRDNFILANEIYKTWRSEGRFPVEFEGGGTRAPAMKVAFAKMNFMSEKYGWEKTERELMTLRSVRDIEQSFELKISGELKDALVPTAVGLGGPKIGNFFANLSGYFDSPTMDLWFMRTIGRMTGGIIATKPGLVKHLDKLLTLLPEKGEVKGISVTKMRKEIAAYKALPEEQRLDPEVTIKVLAQVEKYGRAQYAEFAAPDATGKTFTKKTPENENARSLKSNLSALVEAPGNGTQRDQLRQVVKRALSMLDKTGIKLNAADLQAVLWYYEKNLYAKLGDVSESAKPWDYASAARFGVGREYGLVDVGSSKRAGQVRDGESGVYEDDAGGMDEADGEADAKLSKSRVIFEVAPDPNNEQLTAAWNKLSSKEKLAASESVANKIIPKILAKIGASGTMSPQIGGYMGESNPSFTISLESGNPDAIAKSSGFVLSQDMMIAVSDKPFDGGSETGAITIDIGSDDPADVYARIFEKVKQAEGHTTVGGQMIIINNPDLGIALSDLARQVDAALGGKYDVYADDGIYASFPMKEDYGYGSDNQEQSPAGSPDSQWVGELRAEANDLLKQELAARGIKLSLSRSDVGSAQRAGASDAQAGGEVPGYGTAAPGAIAVQGFHYSTTERGQLDGRYYGTGTKGEEYARVMSSSDPRIKERIYFYVDAGRGITPEQGVGSVGHTVNLNNIYDATNDTWLQAKMGRDFDSNDAWLNAFESAVIDNGFDGYVSDFGTQRAAVLLGRHSVKVQSTQATRGAVAESKPAQENAGADAVAKSRVLPGGKMSGADWKRMVPAVVPGADVSMLDDGKDYYKDDVVAAMRGVKYSLARTINIDDDAWAGYEFVDEKDVTDELANRGFDGLRLDYDFQYGSEKEMTSLAVYSSAQLKSATGNRGTFDGSNPDIRYSTARTPSASAQKEIAAIEERLAKSPSDFVAKNLENIKRGLAGEVVRDEKGNLLAPNGRKSKLTEQQYLQVRTPEFMNWFGDWLSFHNAKNGNGVWEDDAKSVSKVVDDNGEPMVVYHGSERGGFSRMAPEKGDKHRSPMIFAAKTRDTARSYSGRGDEIDLNTGLYEDAEGYDRDENDYDQQRGVYSLFLNIRNPHEADFEGANWDGQVFDKYEVKTPGDPWDAENIYGPNGERFMDYEMAEQVAEENNGEIHDAMDLDENTNSVAEEAKRYGNDGAIIRSVIDDGGRGGVVDPDDVFVIFDSNQAKSATQNVGTFSTTNDDLRYSTRRAINGEFDANAFLAPDIEPWLSNKQLVDLAFVDGKPIRLNVGYDNGPGSGKGAVHLVANVARGNGRRNLDQVTDDDGENVVRTVLNTLAKQGASLHKDKNGSYALRVSLADKALILADQGDHYNIITMLPSAKNKWGDAEWVGRLTFPTTTDATSVEPLSMTSAESSLADQGGQGTYVSTKFNLKAPYGLNQPTAKMVVRPAATVTQKKKRTPDTEAMKADGLKMSPARNILGNNLQQAWSAPDMGKMDDFIYTMQDKQVDMKRVIESIKAAVGSLADKWNPYLKEELFHGRSAKGVKDFMDFELRPLLQEMKMRGVEMAEFEKYLHNRHAEERNRQVARVNPNMPDAGSGIKTADARAYLAALDPQKRQRMDMLARRIDAITSSTLDLLEREGLETPQTIAKLRAAYKYYVPLKRDMGGDGLFGMGTGHGYSVRGASSKRAMGSEKDVVDILANIAMQRERAIVRVEKNRVAQALYGLAIQNPNGDFWAPVDPGKNIQQTVNMLVNLGMNPIDAQGVAKEQKQRYIDPRTGLVAERINPVLRNADNVLAVRINGEDKYLFFSETDARAQRMVHALKNLDADQLGRVMSIMGKATRYFASINTQYNPIFGIINIIRDAQGALLNLSTTPIAGKQKEVLGNTISAMRGIYADIRDHRKGRVPSSQWAQLWEEFQQVGGQTGYKDMFSRSEERAEALAKELKKIGEGKLKAAGRAVFDWLSDYNETLENATRLAAYKVAKDQGMSNDQAASLAKNLTVNFNRKGQVATQAGALYAFFNANVQGTARLVETLKGKSGKKIITGGLLLGSMQAVLLAMAGYDDDEPPAFVRERNLILPLGDHYLTLPMPLGFHVIPSMARIPTEFVLSGFKNPTKRIGEMFNLFADTFNPIGGAGISLQTIAPTVVDPFAALAENRDWTGKQIAKMDRSSTDPTPGHARAKDTASEFSKVLSYWINAASGGTKYKQGLLSPTPDQLDYLIGQATGGVGREYLKAEQVVTSAATGEELPLYKVPLLGRFVGETQGRGPEGGKFYSAVTRLNEHEAEIKGLRSEGKFAEAQAYIAENPEASMVQMANAAERRVADLRKQKRQLLERDASPERIKLVEQQITATMRRFNEQVKLRAEQ